MLPGQAGRQDGDDRGDDMTSQAYDADLLRWSEEQAALLRAGRLAELDYEHILEELEDIGREQELALQSLFRRSLMHLLKLALSPATDPRGKWVDELVEFRAQAQTRLEDTPSLAHYADALFDKAWQQARRGAVKSFQAYGEHVAVPAECPYSLEQCLDLDFVPAGGGSRLGGG
jgi:hypothetical protein